MEVFNQLNPQPALPQTYAERGPAGFSLGTQGGQTGVRSSALSSFASRNSTGGSARDLLLSGVAALLRYFGVGGAGYAVNGSGPRAERAAIVLTSTFEGGAPDSLQTLDDGIISYGPHQATLRSGALENVLRDFVHRSSSMTAQLLQAYLPAVSAKEAALREDTNFLALLRLAADEPEMQSAQQNTFRNSYYLPAKQSAEQLGLRTPLANAIFYDTAVQGGLKTILNRTQSELAGARYSEGEFLQEFLANRRQYLLEIAELKREQGNAVQAQMLENSIGVRVGRFEELLNAGDFSLFSVGTSR